MTTRTFKNICAQGDVMIERMDIKPDLSRCVEVAPEGDNLIVTHSETGHHHVLERDAAQMFDNKDNDLESFLILHRATTLKHLRPHHTHDPIKLDPGQYRVIRQREYTPEGFRRVQD